MLTNYIYPGFCLTLQSSYEHSHWSPEQSVLSDTCHNTTLGRSGSVNLQCSFFANAETTHWPCTNWFDATVIRQHWSWRQGTFVFLQLYWPLTWHHLGCDHQDSGIYPLTNSRRTPTSKADGATNMVRFTHRLIPFCKLFRPTCNRVHLEVSRKSTADVIVVCKTEMKAPKTQQAEVAKETVLRLHPSHRVVTLGPDDTTGQLDGFFDK